MEVSEYVIFSCVFVFFVFFLLLFVFFVVFFMQVLN